jgi:hypothetical protein
MIGNNKSVEGQLKVMIDWMLLGECDILYRTWWSTFGYTASLRGDVTTQVIPHQYNKECRVMPPFPVENVNAD